MIGVRWFNGSQDGLRQQCSGRDGLPMLNENRRAATRSSASQLNEAEHPHISNVTTAQLQREPTGAIGFPLKGHAGLLLGCVAEGP